MDAVPLACGEADPRAELHGRGMMVRTARLCESE